MVETINEQATEQKAATTEQASITEMDALRYSVR